MSLVFNTPKTTLNTTTRDIQNLNSECPPCPECDLEAGSAEYTENGSYTLSPEEADGFSSVSITVDVPSDVNNQEKTVTITSNGQSTITADSGYTGLSSVGVTVNVDTTTPYNEGYAAGETAQKAKLTSTTITENGTTTREDGFNSVTVNVQPDLETKTASYNANGQYTITPTAGKDGISEATVTVAVPSDVNNQNKTVTPTTSSQSVTADSGYSGLGTVTVDAVTSSIDANIAAGNIKSGVTILGVTGTVTEGITPTGNINITNTNSTDVTNYATAQVVDANLTAGNIKSGTTILGVEGSYDPQPNLDTLNVTPSTSAQTLTPTSPVDGFDEVVVSAVTSSIDANIAAGNIKDGVTILGVTGNYTGGGGGTNVPDWSLIGYTSQDLGWLDDAVAYSKTIKDTADLGSTINVRGDEKLAFVASGGTYEYSSGSGAFNKCYGLLQVKDVTVVNPIGNNNSFNSLFSNCYSLRTVGSVTFKRSGVTVNPSSLGSCFTNCCSLISVPNWNYSECQDFSNFLSWSLNSTPPNSGNLKTIPLMNMQSAIRVDNMFNKMSQDHITDGISGFQYLGKAFTGTNATSHTLNLQYMPNLTKTSVMNIINNVSAPDDSTATDATLKLAAEVYALLDASDIAVATAKNWSVVSA